MRLLQPNPGEVVDRQTILSLKCVAGLKKKINVQPFVDEANQLQTYLEKNWFPLTPKKIQHDYDTAYNELKAVNKKLWDLEDEVRAFKSSLNHFTSIEDAAAVIVSDPSKPYAKRIVEIALLVPTLNDQRSALVAKINALFLITTQEKVYA